MSGRVTMKDAGSNPVRRDFLPLCSFKFKLDKEVRNLIRTHRALIN